MAYKSQFESNGSPKQQQQQSSSNLKKEQAANKKADKDALVRESLTTIERICLAQIGATSEILGKSIAVAQTLADKVSEEDSASVFGDLLGFLASSQDRALASEEKLTELVLEKAEQAIKEIAPLMLMQQKLQQQRMVKNQRQNEAEEKVENLEDLVREYGEREVQLIEELKESSRERASLEKALAQLREEQTGADRSSLG